MLRQHCTKLRSSPVSGAARSQMCDAAWPCCVQCACQASTVAWQLPAGTTACLLAGTLAGGLIRATQLLLSRQRLSRQHGRLSPVCARLEGAHPSVQVKLKNSSTVSQQMLITCAAFLIVAGMNPPVVLVAACCCLKAIRSSSALSLQQPAQHLPSANLTSTQATALPLLQPIWRCDQRMTQAVRHSLSRTPSDHPSAPCLACRDCLCNTTSRLRTVPSPACTPALCLLGENCCENVTSKLGTPAQPRACPPALQGLFQQCDQAVHHLSMSNTCHSSA